MGEESVPLQDSLNRRPSCNLLTTIPVPHFCELVRTAIFALHGKRDAPGKGADRPGTGYYHQKKRGVLNLKSGITTVRSGLLSVRPAGLTGPSIATILIPGNRRLIRAGEKVTIHLH